MPSLVFLISLSLFTVGSLLCGLATSDTELIFFRVLQGIGGGMIMPLAQIIMADAAGPKRMGRVMALVAVPMMLAPTLGPLLGGILIQTLSWHWIFFVNIVVGAFAIPLAFRLLPSPAKGRDRTEALDFLGLALMSTGLVGITYGLAEAGTYDSFTNAHVWVPVWLVRCSWPRSPSTRCGSSTRCSTSACTAAGTSRRLQS